MQVDLPSGESFDYQVRGIRAQAHDSDEIFAKRLLVLLLFYIMRYEGRFAEIEDDEAATAEPLEEVTSLRQGLERAACEGRHSELYERIVELSVRVSDFVLAKQQALAGEVKRSMGGEVLELMVDRIAAAKKEAYGEGRKEILAAVIKELKELGVDAAIIERAFSAEAQ